MPKRQESPVAIRSKKMFIVTGVIVVAIACVAAWAVVRQVPAMRSVGTATSHRTTDESLHPNTPAPPSAPASPATPKKHDYVIPPVVNGLAPVLSRIPTKEPVVFLGIDDGAQKAPFDLQMMKANRIRASLFLADIFVRDQPQFFADFVRAGSLIENHTVHHRMLSDLSYGHQKQEICDQADRQQQLYGRRPVLFRPPGGDYNMDTRKAAAACGMRAVILWIAKANGGMMEYQVGNSLQRGDIVLMHFRPEFQRDMQSFLDAQNAAGLHTELLEDWLPTTQP
jgi:hypothetical protein